MLEETWDAFGPFLASSSGAAAVARVSLAADRRAGALPDVASFAVERARPILDQFSLALPRNLILAVAGSTGHRPG